MRQLALIFVIFDWVGITHDVDEIDENKLFDLGVSRDGLNTIFKIDQSSLITDRCFLRTGKKIKRTRNFPYQSMRYLLNSYLVQLGDSQFNNYIGDFFENSYVIPYLKTDSSIIENYFVHPGFVPHEIFPENRYGDIDLIIEDSISNFYYFVQVKYMRIGSRPYLSGDVETLCQGTVFKGIKQLRATKKYLDNNRLDHLLRVRKIQCNLSNTAFVLIHNNSSFDFQQTEDGICLYDWNTFRNLLKKGRLSVGVANNRSLDENEAECRGHLPIHNPSRVADELGKLLSEQPQTKSMNLFRTGELHSKFKVGKYLVDIKGLGI